MTPRTVTALILMVVAVLGCHRPATHRSRHSAPVVTSEPTASATATTPADDAPTGIQALALGMPQQDVTTHLSGDDDAVLTERTYAVSYNRSKGGPNWAAWRINAADYGGAKRAGRFEPNPALPDDWYHVRHSDYTGSGYDRGHMVDAGDRSHDDRTMAETFLTTNILPQTHALNGGPWLGLESACRTLAKHDGRVVYVVAGPVWGPQAKTIAGGKVAVPLAFWKVAVVLARGQSAADITAETPVMAAVMPNDEGIEHTKWTTYRATLRETQRRAGWQVLTALSAEQRTALEGK